MTDDTKAQACADAFKPLAEIGNVKRYGLIEETCEDDDHAVMGIGPQADGKFVLFTDCATLSAQLAAICEAVRDAVEDNFDSTQPLPRWAIDLHNKAAAAMGGAK